MAKVLITGASGNVGGYVAEQLIQLGEQVVCAGTAPARLGKIYGNRAEARMLDFTDQATFQDALTEVDRVFLMRPPHLGKPEDLYPFIEAMRQTGIKLVSFLSLMGVENNTITPHYKIEKRIEQVGLPYAHIRPGFFMQNVSGIHAVEIREQDQIFVPAGTSKTSFIDAEDIGSATAILLHNPDKYKNTAHTITGPQALDYYEVAQILSKVTGRKITYAKPGYLRYRNYYIKKRGLAKDYVNVTVALYFMTRLGTAKAVTNEFFQLTGQQPRTFEDFALANRAAFMKG